MSSPRILAGYIPLATYAVTRDFGLLFSVITWILFTVVAAVLAIVSWAAYGYDTISISSTDFNGTQSLWYDAFIPGPLRSLVPDSSCQPFTYRLGDSFRTSARIFTWELTNVNQNQDDQGNWQTGSLYTALPYSNVELKYCDVLDMTIYGNLPQQSLQFTTRIMCTVPIPILATTTVVYSPWLALDTYDNTPWALSYDPDDPDLWNNVIGMARPPQSNISQAVELLGYDLYDCMSFLYYGSNGSSPTALSLPITFQSSNISTWCPAAFLNAPGWCTSQEDATPPQFELGIEQIIMSGWPEFNPVSEAGDLSPTGLFTTPILNIVRALHGAVRTDLGSFRPNNLFQNATALQQQLNSTVALWFGTRDTPYTFDGACGPDLLCGADALLNANDSDFVFSALPFNSTGPSVIETTYLCNRQVQKSAAALFFSITSGTFSNLFAAYGFWMFVSTWYLKKKRMNPNVCEGHLSNSSPLVAPVEQYAMSATGSVVQHGKARITDESPRSSAANIEIGEVHELRLVRSLSLANRSHGYTRVQTIDSSDPNNASDSIPVAGHSLTMAHSGEESSGTGAASSPPSASGLPAYLQQPSSESNQVEVERDSVEHLSDASHSVSAPLLTWTGPSQMQPLPSQTSNGQQLTTLATPISSISSPIGMVGPASGDSAEES